MAFIHHSKTLSYLLRHGASNAGMAITQDGYVRVADVLKYRDLRGITEEQLYDIVRNCPKQRFMLKTDERGITWIRAAQGHSITSIDEEKLLTPITAADVVKYPVVVHGTYLQAWKCIEQSGLKRMSRLHVHFATGLPSSSGVVSGMRKSSQVFIYLNLKQLVEDGVPVFISSNNVILSPGDQHGVIHPKYFAKVEFR